MFAQLMQMLQSSLGWWVSALALCFVAVILLWQRRQREIAAIRIQMHVTERQACEAELADLREVIARIMPLPEGGLLDHVTQIVGYMRHIERELQYSRACSTRCAAHLQPWLESRSTAGAPAATPSTREQEKLLADHVAGLMAELQDKEAELADLRQHEAQMAQYLHSVATTMAESIQIIPVLNAQLGDVTEQTETAAMGLGDSFRHIIARVNEDLAHTRTLFGAFITEEEDSDGEQSGLTRVLQRNQQAMTSIQSVLEAVYALHQRLRTEFSQILDQAAAMGKDAAEIESLAEQSRLLAFNAVIEAARAGEHGRAFGVVAEEVNQMADRSEKVARHIQQAVQDMRESSEATYQHLHNLIENDVAHVQHSRGELQDVLTEYVQIIEGLSAGIKDMTASTRGVNDDISRIVVSLQFQDITRQRGEHVVQMLEKIRESLQRSQEEAEAVGHLLTSDDSDSHWNDLFSMYSMENERATAKTILGIETPALAVQPQVDDGGFGDNVELF